MAGSKRTVDDAAFQQHVEAEEASLARLEERLLDGSWVQVTVNRFVETDHATVEELRSAIRFQAEHREKRDEQRLNAILDTMVGLGWTPPGGGGAQAPDLIEYEHFAYFKDRATADACAADLRKLGCQTDIASRKEIEEAVAGLELKVVGDLSGGPSEEEREAFGREYPWSLSASREEDFNRWSEQHQEVQDIVERHGGVYDGGGCMVS